MVLPFSTHRQHLATAIPRTHGPPPLLLRLAAVLTVPVLLYMLYSTGLKALDNYNLNVEAAALSQEIRDLRAENIHLQEEILRARTDAAVESAAREHLGLVLPGDRAVILTGSSESGQRGEILPNRPPAPEPRPVEQWWRHFFGPPNGNG